MDASNRIANMQHTPQNLDHLRSNLAMQISEIDAMIAAHRKEQRDAAIEQLRAMMDEHGITAADILPKPGPIKLVMRHITRASVRTSKPTPGVTYDFGGVRYTTGKRGKPPAAYSAAKFAGTLEKYRVI